MIGGFIKLPSNKKMAAGFLRTPPLRGLCWDENSKDQKEDAKLKLNPVNESKTLIAKLF